MHADLNITLSVLFGFALTLVRVSGIFIFLPWPGAQAGPTAARIAFALASTLALAPLWPRVETLPSNSTLVAWVLGEAALGLLAGVATGWIAEIFVTGAQVLSVQAGYSFASTFDPNTQADSGILQIFAQLMAGLMFFATGLDRQLIRAFAVSMQTCPPGSFVLNVSMAGALIRIGSEVLALAVRLALPVIGLLFFVDLVLGVLGRVNSHMQVISLAFPVKMLIALLMLASLLTVFPLLYQTEAKRVLELILGAVAAH